MWGELCIGADSCYYLREGVGISPYGQVEDPNDLMLEVLGLPPETSKPQILSVTVGGECRSIGTPVSQHFSLNACLSHEVHSAE